MLPTISTPQYEEFGIESGLFTCIDLLTLVVSVCVCLCKCVSIWAVCPSPAGAGRLPAAARRPAGGGELPRRRALAAGQLGAAVSAGLRAAAGGPGGRAAHWGPAQHRSDREPAGRAAQVGPQQQPPLHQQIYINVLEIKEEAEMYWRVKSFPNFFITEIKFYGATISLHIWDICRILMHKPRNPSRILSAFLLNFTWTEFFQYSLNCFTSHLSYCFMAQIRNHFTLQVIRNFILKNRKRYTHRTIRAEIFMI